MDKKVKHNNFITDDPSRCFAIGDLVTYNLSSRPSVNGLVLDVRLKTTPHFVSGKIFQVKVYFTGLGESYWLDDYRLTLISRAAKEKAQ